MKHFSQIGLALLAGAILALMTSWNARLSMASSPVIASMIAHGVGTIASALLVLAMSTRREPVVSGVTAPFWANLGGVPGALTVLMASVTVTGPLGLAGTLALVLMGQMTFSLATDAFGWLGAASRPIDAPRLLGCLLISFGSLLIIMARA